MTYLFSGIIAALVSIGAIFIPHTPEQTLSPQMRVEMQKYIEQAMAAPVFGTTQAIAGQTYNLGGAGVSQTGTSITLASFTITQNGYKILDADLSDTFYITLEPGNSSRQEIVSCTTSVQNANNSATFSGCTRGLLPIQPYTASSSLRFSHGGGTPVIFSNPPQFYAEFAQLQNTETITGSWTFSKSAPPLYDYNPTIAYWTGASSSTIPTKAYVDSVAIAGASNANESTKGIVESATQIEMASSTSLGSTGASLYVQSKYATSSPGSAGLWAVITNNAGKIAQTFLDFTQQWSFTATTSIAASNASTTALILNGLPYQITGTRGASSTALMENGYGHLVWQRPDFGLIAYASTTAAAATTTLTFPAYTGGTDMRIVIDTGPIASSISSVYVQFNGDTAANYSWAILNEAGVATNGLSVPVFKICRLVGHSGDAFYATMEVANRSGMKKGYHGMCHLNGDTAFDALTFDTIAGAWNNAGAQITSVSVGCGAANCPIGTRISVYGSTQ